MVLTAAPIGKNFQIAKVNGNELSGNVIIHVKDTRIALDKSLSNRIHVK